MPRCARRCSARVSTRSAPPDCAVESTRRVGGAARAGMADAVQDSRHGVEGGWGLGTGEDSGSCLSGLIIIFRAVASDFITRTDDARSRQRHAGPVAVGCASGRPGRWGLLVCVVESLSLECRERPSPGARCLSGLGRRGVCNATKKACYERDNTESVTNLSRDVVACYLL